MTLRDRLRRWRRPAQWADDHPLSPEERLVPKVRPGHWSHQAMNDRRVDVTRPFKKPR
jgi:hypothetical protein